MKIGVGRRFAVVAAASSILASIPSAVASQSRPVVRPTREEVTRPVTQPRPQGSRLEVTGGIERAPCALEGPEFKSIHFVLRGAEFDGLQGLTRADLVSVYQPYMGRDVQIS